MEYLHVVFWTGHARDAFSQSIHYGTALDGKAPSSDLSLSLLWAVQRTSPRGKDLPVELLSCVK